ncbi:MAG: Phosphoribosyl-ATP pyrophosphatase, partial [uncultured Friedmanniella sp.]
EHQDLRVPLRRALRQGGGACARLQHGGPGGRRRARHRQEGGRGGRRGVDGRGVPVEGRGRRGDQPAPLPPADDDDRPGPRPRGRLRPPV